MPERYAGIGYSARGCQTPSDLDRQLHTLATIGYDIVELAPADWEVWFAGQLAEAALTPWLAVLDRYLGALRFTVHAPPDINLSARRERALHRNLLQSTLALAARIGAEVVVVHPGRRTADDWQGDETMRELLERERRTLLAALAELDVPVALETWFAAISDYSYASWPDQLAAHVEPMADQGVGICLDVGHVFLASRWYGFDFIEGVRRIAPHVRHIHLQDTFGRNDPVRNDVGDALLGHGDLHIPPGWGAVPLGELFAAIEFSRGPAIIAELASDRYLPHAAATLGACQRLVGHAIAHDGHR